MLLTLPGISSLPPTLELAHDLIVRLYSELARVEQLARIDALTGIANRRAFDERLVSAFAFARRTNSSLTVAVLDLDLFKRRNDALGHAAGDRALRLVGEHLRTHSRAGDLVARIGGEEFAILLPNTCEADGADLCRRLARALRMGCAVGGPLTFSCGVAELDASMLHPSVILERADRAMYHAKQSGRDRVCVHQPTYNRAAAFFGRMGIL